MNKLTLPIATLISCSLLFAEETPALEKANQEKSPWEFSLTASGAYYPEAEHKTGSSHFSGVNGIYDGAKAVVEFDVAYTLPFLRGNDEFTKENHIVFNTGLEVTPVSVAPVASITVSPIAFLEFAIGGTVGTGWSIGDLFQGMAKYEAAKPEYKNLTPFAHWLLYGWASACLMFDLAAVWDGDWHHVVATATYKAGYKKMTGTNADIWL